MIDEKVNYKNQIIDAINELDLDALQRVLTFARQQSIPRGKSGKEMIEASKNIKFEPGVLDQMMKDIEEEFEQIEDFPDVELD